MTIINKNKNNITIIKAKKNMLPGLEEVWWECFHDDLEYIRFFYECNFNRIITYAALDCSKIIGILHLIPSEIDGREAYYGYAMGMLPEYRGTGIFPLMHRTVFDYVRERGAAYFLKPANGKLAVYYSGQGLTEGFYLKRVEYAADINKSAKINIDFADLGADEYKKLRDAFFNCRGYVKWDEAALQYAIAENLRSGGFVKKIKLPEGEFAVFGTLYDDTVFLRETTLPGGLLDKYGGTLAAIWGAGRLEADVPVYSNTKNGGIVPVGMIYNMDKDCGGYFNLPLD